MGIGALCAIPPLAIYLWIPRLIDRYDPEPWWALALVLGWGAIAACGVAATVNTGVEVAATEITGGKEFGQIAGVCFSAPIVEEGMKGMAVLGVFYFLRREFDGVVDGVIYATFVALGFAATENIIYYANAVKSDPNGNVLAVTFLLRGVLAPWGHPLYTSMTGIGFGIARETHRPWLRWMAPIFGYCAAMFLHCMWNTASTISGFLFLLMLPLWLLFVAAFIGILIWLVVRKGKIIRMHLQDEVLLGTLTPQELALVTSAVGGMLEGVVQLGRRGGAQVRPHGGAPRPQQVARGPRDEGAQDDGERGLDRPAASRAGGAADGDRAGAAATRADAAGVGAGRRRGSRSSRRRRSIRSSRRSIRSSRRRTRRKPQYPQQAQQAQYPSRVGDSRRPSTSRRSSTRSRGKAAPARAVTRRSSRRSSRRNNSRGGQPGPRPGSIRLTRRRRTGGANGARRAEKGASLAVRCSMLVSCWPPPSTTSAGTPTSW